MLIASELATSPNPVYLEQIEQIWPRPDSPGGRRRLRPVYRLVCLMTGLFVLMGYSLPVQAQSPEADNVEFVAQLGGTIQALFVEGQYAYINQGGRLIILDITAPTGPAVVGQTPPLAVISDIYVSGGLAYIAAGENGVRIIDVSDPTQPVPAGAIDTPGDATRIYVSGTLAYVADWASGLQIIDASDPANPTLAGTGAFDPMEVVVDVFVKDNLAYLVVGSQDLRVVDVSDPAAPTSAGLIDTPGWAERVDLSGGLAYVGVGRSLRVIDYRRSGQSLRNRLF